MRPISPVVPGLEQHELKYAEHQPQYLALPSIRSHGRERSVMSRWRLDPGERAAIAAGADVFLTLSTFGKPLQPIMLQVDPDPNAREIAYVFELDKPEVPIPPDIRIVVLGEGGVIIGQGTAHEHPAVVIEPVSDSNRVRIGEKANDEPGPVVDGSVVFEIHSAAGAQVLIEAIQQAVEKLKLQKESNGQ